MRAGAEGNLKDCIAFALPPLTRVPSRNLSLSYSHRMHAYIYICVCVYVCMRVLSFSSRCCLFRFALLSCYLCSPLRSAFNQAGDAHGSHLELYRREASLRAASAEGLLSSLSSLVLSLVHTHTHPHTPKKEKRRARRCGGREREGSSRFAFLVSRFPRWGQAESPRHRLDSISPRFVDLCQSCADEERARPPTCCADHTRRAQKGFQLLRGGRGRGWGAGVGGREVRLSHGSREEGLWIRGRRLFDFTAPTTAPGRNTLRRPRQGRRSRAHAHRQRSPRWCTAVRRWLKWESCSRTWAA